MKYEKKKLESKEFPSTINEYKKLKKQLIIAWIVVGFLIIGSIVFFLIPFSYGASEFYNVQEPYTYTEDYWVKEPFNVQEPYQVKEPYTYYESLDYRVLERKHYNHFWTLECDVWITIKNLDDVGGYFSADFDVETSKGDHKVTTTEHFIASGKTYKFLVTLPGAYKSSISNANYPSKEVIGIRTVTKYRTVIDYKNVKKTNLITKYKTVQKERLITQKDTLFNMVMGKTQYVFYV